VHIHWEVIEKQLPNICARFDINLSVFRITRGRTAVYVETDKNVVKFSPLGDFLGAYEIEDAPFIRRLEEVV
jgi:hypothetical protein